MIVVSGGPTPQSTTVLCGECGKILPATLVEIRIEVGHLTNATVRMPVRLDQFRVDRVSFCVPSRVDQEG